MFVPVNEDATVTAFYMNFTSKLTNITKVFFIKKMEVCLLRIGLRFFVFTAVV